MTDTDNKLPRQYQTGVHQVTVTFFDNAAAKTKREEQLTLPDLAIVVQNENRIEKRRLPWFKFAIFGDIKTTKGSLRHDANMQMITGVEVEHDSGKISFDRAVQLMHAADIRCLIYTTPSHLVANEDGVAVEKWRIMAPTAEALPVSERYGLAARINGVLGGGATAESFTQSQSYYFGSVKRNPHHRVQVVDGGYFIDGCDDLDAGAIGAPQKPWKERQEQTGPAEPEATPGHTEADLDELVATANDIDRNGDRQWHNNMRSVVASMVKKFKTDAEIYERCAPACREGYGDKDVKKLIDTARVKYEITDPETSSNDFINLLSEFAADAAAAGIKGPGFRVKTQATLKLTDFYAFLPTHNYILRHTGEMWQAAGVNAALPKVKVGTEQKKLKKKDKTDPKGPDEFETVDVLLPPSVWLDMHRPVAQISWMPGHPELIEGEVTLEGGLKPLPGASIYNMYQPPRRVNGNAKRVKPWLELVWEIYPDHADHIIKFLAHRIQRPEVKINHALVLTGSPGIGKDTILAPVKYGVGPWNFKEVSPHDITSNNNDYMKSTVLRISEARDLGDVNKFKMYETMKTMLAAPPDMVRVNVKYVPQYYVVNVTGVIITTNYPSDGLYLPATDRRHYVCGTEATKDDFDPDYWTGMWAWYAAGGIDDVVAYLEQYDLSDFDAKVPPDKTPAFWRMVDGSVAAEVPGIWDAIDRLGERQADGSMVPPTVITLDMVTEACANDPGEGSLYMWLKNRANLKLIHHRFDACGYVPVRNNDRADGLWLIGGVRKSVYGLMSVELPKRVAAAKALSENKQGENVK
jgi:hypothetical protein